MFHVRRNKIQNKLFLGQDNKYYLSAQFKERQRTTPDMLEIRKEKLQLVFTYGTLMRGYWNHQYLRNATFLGAGRTAFEKYEMYDSGFPVLREVTDSGSYVYGEVYAVDADTFMGLDYLESNGIMYNRKKVPIKLFQQGLQLDEEEKNKIFPMKDCWTYFGDDEYWDGYKNLTEIQVERPLPSLWLGLSFDVHHKHKIC